jgi:hypothetical protein
VVSLHTGFFRHLDHMFDWLRRPTSFGNRVLTAADASAPDTSAPDARAPDGPRSAGPAPAAEGVANAVSLTGLVSESRLYAACRPIAEELYRQVSRTNPDASLVVEKTPEHLLNAELIRAVLPEARFLHVVRDPRAVYASMRSALKQWAYPGDFPTNPQTFVRRRWLRYLDAWDRLEPAPALLRTLRYEDLVADTAGELVTILRWLDLPADAAFCARAVEACSIERLRKDPAAPAGFFRRGRVDSWREELSATDVRVIEYLAGGRMAALGYPCETAANGGPPLRLRAADAWASGLQRLADGPLRVPVQKLIARLRLRRDWQR